jgi:MoaA/NifB/PqqE/SkfB family radical SAM enzyme
MLGGVLSGGLSTPTARHAPAGDNRLLLEGILLERGLELRSIDSIRRIIGRVRVYNFSCPPIEAYEANGIVVHNCHFCAYRMEGGFTSKYFGGNPARFIPTAKAKEILDDCAAIGVKAIEFTGGGEPTVHKDWAEIIAHALSLGLQCALVTNGVRLNAFPMLEALTWLRVSLDAGTAETYERIRQSKAWPTVMRNLESVGKLRGPLVGVGFVITRENYGELVRACEIAKGYGIPYVRVSAMFSEAGAGYYDGIEGWINAERMAARTLQDERFRVIDFFDNRVEDLRQAAPDYSFCGYQQFVTYIGGDQKVYTCCTNAYTPHGEIGDLREQRFAEWFATTRRRDFNARSCHHCQYHGINRVVNYMLSEPAHVEFV